MTYRLADEAHSALGANPLILHDAAVTGAVQLDAAVVVAIDRAGTLPALNPALFDAMVTTRPAALAPWVSVSPVRLEAQCDAVRSAVANAPIAAAILARTLQIGECLPFEDALEVESLAYSTLLGGSEFGRWLAGRKPQSDPGSVPRVDYAREGNVVTLRRRA